MKYKLKIKVKQVENVLIFKTKEDIDLVVYSFVKSIEELYKTGLIGKDDIEIIKDAFLSVVELNSNIFSFSLPNNEVTQKFIEILSSWKEIELKPMKLKELLDKS